MNLDAKIDLAVLLIRLGIATAEQIKNAFAQDGHDDETLAKIMSDVDVRLARRG